MNIKIYDSSNIDNMDWQNTKDGKFSERYLTDFIKNEPINFIDNTDIEMNLISFEDGFLPITISKAKTDIKNSYVCSPISHYIDYGKEEVEIELKNSPLFKDFSLKVISLLENYFKARDFDNVIYVNNWLLSTNLYKEFNLKILKEIKNLLIEKYPDKAIVFRSVNEVYNNDLYRELSLLNFKHILSRQVYILDPKKEIYKKKESYQKDLKIRKKSKYYWDDSTKITEKDFSRIKYLYDDLYIKKYSSLNPKFNERFIKTTMNDNCFTYKVLKKEDEIYAVFGYFERSGMITAPLFGYDTSINVKDGLYRLTALEILEDAIKNNLIVHQSSGVSKFKMFRGAEPSIEYNMVYYKHLPKKRQNPWKLLNKLTDYAIIPVMRKYQL